MRKKRKEEIIKLINFYCHNFSCIIQLMHNRLNKISFVILSVFSLIFCDCLIAQISKSEFIPFTNSKIVYEGRTGKDGASAIIYWPGTQIEINFKGTSVGGIFWDNTGNNYYNIIVDNDSIIIFRPDMVKQNHILVSNLSNEPHNLKIYRRTEWTKGITYFYGFVLENGTYLLPPPEKKKRKLEFYGNSITAGFGVEDYSGRDRSDSIYTNNYLTYAAFTARYFNAQSHYIVRSGIGVMVSYFPLIMPELYYRLNPNDPESKWDFRKYQPGIVVINLLQNDAYLFKMRNRKEFLYRFGHKPEPDENFIINSYISFVRQIRGKYPQAHIICMLGNLGITQNGSPWPGYVQKAVNHMSDPKIYTLFVPYKNTLGHPRVEEQKKMADTLIHFIEKRIEW
jgi:hypothetical protein